MINRKFLALPLLLLFFACTSEKKSDTPRQPLTIDPAAISEIFYTTGDNFFDGYTKYNFTFDSKALVGSWGRVLLNEDGSFKGRVVADSGSVITKEEFLEVKKSLENLNNSIVETDKSQCGQTLDGGWETLNIKFHSQDTKPLTIAEISNLKHLCADSYVSEGGLKPLIETLSTLLPTPDDAQFKPWEIP